MDVHGPSRAARSPVVRRNAARRRVSRGGAGLFAAGYARMGSGIYLALGLVAVHGRGLAPVALLVAGLASRPSPQVTPRACRCFPRRAARRRSHARAGGELASFVTGWATSLALVAIAALAALFGPQYLSMFWAPLATRSCGRGRRRSVIGVLAAGNVRGLEQSASVTAFLGVVNLITQGLLIVLGAAFIFSPGQIRQDVHFGAAPSLEQLVLACALAMVAFTGIDAIGEMAGEARDPDRDLPPAAGGVLGSAITLSVALGSSR